uniref:Uncharacterized protein n=1 Tax=Timema cristinae TaxID=61476 RepID=A0A7R9D2K6_TIMCR|nr:unnamed protein product [Timema cristinae]
MTSQTNLPSPLNWFHNRIPLMIEEIITRYSEENINDTMLEQHVSGADSPPASNKSSSNKRLRIDSRPLKHRAFIGQRTGNHKTRGSSKNGTWSKERNYGSTGPFINRTKRLNHGIESRNVSFFIKDQLKALIESVLQVLRRVNPKKVDELTSLVGNPSALVILMNKPKIQKFFDSLCVNVITSSDGRGGSSRTLSPSDNSQEMELYYGERETRAENLELSETSEVLGHMFRGILDDTFTSIETDSSCGNNALVKTAPLEHTFHELYKDSAESHNKRSNISLNTLQSGSSLVPHGINIFREKISIIQPSKNSDEIKGYKSAFHEEKRRDQIPSVSYETLPNCPPRKIIDIADVKDFQKKGTRQRNSRQNIMENKSPSGKEEVTSKEDVSETSSNLEKAFMESKNVSRYPRRPLINKSSAATSSMTKEAKSFVSVKPRTQVGADRSELVGKEILNRMSNAQRILVGMKAAHVKNHILNMKGVEQKVPLGSIVGPVLSKESLLALASGCKERELIFMSVSKGGLGLYQGLPPRGIRKPSFKSVLESRSRMRLTLEGMARVKQEVAVRETDKKIQRFLKEMNL